MKETLSLRTAWSRPYVQAGREERLFLQIEISSGTHSERLQSSGLSEGQLNYAAKHVLLNLHVSDRVSIIQVYGQPTYQHIGETTIMAGSLRHNHVKTIVVELSLQAHDPGTYPVLLISGEYMNGVYGSYVDIHYEVNAAFTADPNLLIAEMPLEPSLLQVKR
ncbi:hypothetical protein FHS18_006671 [Paenibacillus phyllosphaerae]|uniref:Uncharacterized protein n=1 Tax=Paenibacillus phyllosphaerae TaxID=274593 RepID=A0A7W5FRI0_9BACL|nr:hypothetical protein [Paenibacillus phyllosphaerae]MBB3114550.1 hypothetical protein [Paenibacillus phyllosphaerae]